MGQKIAIVGGGIFGITSAIRLSREGYSVDLFERNHDIMQAASGINQYRLHLGYHYPRSIETVHACKNSNQSFVSEFPDAIITNPKQYYLVAKDGSKLNGEQYLSFCKQQGLEYIIAVPEIVRASSIDVGILTNETRWDPKELYKAVWEKLKTSSVNVFLKTEATRDMLKKYDFVVIATYANINDLLVPDAQKDYQFELCEKPVVLLPPEYRGKGFVIMDGHFTSVDPLGKSYYHVIANVVHAIHHTNIGKKPERYHDLEPYLNKGIVKKLKITNFAKFIETATQFFHGIEQSKHVGSMFTYRAVLPNVDDTDERPTIVEKVEKNIIKIFSGKITTCTIASERVVELIKRELGNYGN